MQRFDDVSSAHGNLKEKDYLFLLILGIVSVLVFFFSANELFVTGVMWYVVPAVVTFFLTPYTVCAGNRETYRPGWIYFKFLFYWILVLIVTPLILSTFL